MNAFLRALSITALMAAVCDYLLPEGQTGDTGRLIAGLCVMVVVTRGLMGVLRLMP